MSHPPFLCFLAPSVAVADVAPDVSAFVFVSSAVLLLFLLLLLLLRRMLGWGIAPPPLDIALPCKKAFPSSPTVLLLQCGNRNVGMF